MAIYLLAATLSVTAATYSLLPATLPFGPQTVGTQSAPLTITLNNRAKTQLVFNLGSSSPEFTAVSACGGVVVPGASCIISVRFTPAATGNRTATLTVTDATKATNKDTVKLSGVGSGTPSVAPASLSFGNVATNVTSPPQNLTFTNNQATPVSVTSLTPSNSDYTASGCTATVAAGASCTIAVRFRPTAPAGTVENATLSIAHTGISNPLSVGLSGASVVPFELVPMSVAFPATFQGQVASSTVTVRNNQSASTSVTASAGAPFSVIGCGGTIAGGATCALTVRFSPLGAHEGLIAGTLAVSSTTPAVYAANAPLSGTAVRPVTVAPPSLDFTGVTVASTSEPLQVTVTNHQPGALTFGVPLASFSGAAAGDFAPGATTCGATLAGGASCVVDISFHPTVGGARQATLNINSNAFGSPHTVALVGVGTTPLTISPASIGFGNVNVGLDSVAQAVSIQNNQSVPAALTSLTFSDDFSQAPVGTTCGASLPAQQSCVVAIVATPAAAGARIGSLIIASNTTESPDTVTLSANGVNGVTASLLSLTFAPQQISTTSTSQQIVLTNHQNVAAALGTNVSGDFAANDACGGTIPPQSTCAVSVTFTPTATGSRIGSVAFNNPGSPATVVALQGEGAVAGAPAAILSVVPGTGTVGTTTIGIVVTGNESTHFDATSAVDFGAGATVSNLRNVSAHALTVDVALAGGALPGARAVTVTTSLAGGGTEVATLAAGFVVSASANPPLASVSPDFGAQGQLLDVQIVGTDTHFQSGTYADFGDGVVVNQLTIVDPTHATANVSVSSTAELGWRSVFVVTGGEIATIAPAGVNGPGFRVVAGNAQLLSVTPASGAQGAVPFAVSITGDATSFLQGASNVSFEGGILVGSVTVSDATHLTVTITVTAGAGVGPHTVTVTTGGEVTTLVDGFTVTAAPPASLSSVQPNTAQQGGSVSLTILGSNTHFTTDVPAPSLTLGSNITIDPLVVVDDTTITTSVAVDALAFTGARQGTLSTGGTNYAFAFTVTSSGASITAVTPASGPQGGVVTVTVTGQNTHWSQGSTTATFPALLTCGPTVNLVTVDSETQATLTVSIPANACVGSQVLRFATGGEVLDTVFGVYAQTPSLTLGPSNGLVGSSPIVNFLGEFTHFDATTTAVIDGTGVAIQNFAATSAGSATAKFQIAADAPTGVRTVTLTTPLGGGAYEVVAAAFVAGSTPARLMSLQPFHAAPGTQALLTLTGEFTHFGPTTTVGLGPDVQVSAPTIVTPTELTVLVDISAGAATGWRTVFLNTGSEQLTAGFRIDSAAAPSIQSVTPSTAVQSQSLPVTITGASTSFNQSSRLILGAGVTVSDFVVTSLTTATATVAISPTAPIGPNTVIVLTDTAPGQTEVASGAGFNVGRGPSSILTVTPNVMAQNQIVNVAIVGQGTHWDGSGTSVDFGPGITVAQFAVQDATHATAQLFVLSTAQLGFHAVTFVTDGEITSKAQGVDVQEGTPALLSSTPNVGAQGTSFAVTVLGSLTHWTDDTTAGYGPGVVVTGVTVVDSVSAILNVTIDPLAVVGQAGSCHPLTIITGNEQVTLPSQLCVQAGAAVLTTVSPNAALQGSTLTVQVTGQNTHFAAGLTQASFGNGINTSIVAVTSPTTASVDLAVSSQAAGGFRTATFTTLGESASLALAFNVGQNTPTLNVAAPFSGQRDQSLSVRLIGQYTHWTQGATTVTFGDGISVGAVTVVSATTLDVAIDIDNLAPLGGRTVTVTTGGEIVSASVFTVLAGGASLTSVSPQSGNQGQQVTLTVTGQNTDWQQGITQFAIAGGGNDITVNFVVINGPTSATIGLTVAPAAAPGPRSVFMITGPEALVSAGAFVVTGGVPAIGSISPASARAGDTGLNVEITGLYTTWLTGTTTVDLGPGILLSNVVVNSDTRITAVLNVDVAAGLGFRTVAVRNASLAGAQALTGSFQVVSPQPPLPSLQYIGPNAGLRGQTFTINLSATNTHFDPAPGATEVDFGDPLTAGIEIVSFQVTSQTTARVKVTIAGNATVGARAISIVTHSGTGDEIVQGTFTVVQATPQLTIVDPSAGMQGGTATVTLVGSYTGFNEGTTFDFGPGITILDSQAFGPAVAQVELAIDDLAALGGRYITATTGTEVVTAVFSVTPSTAVILTVTPNTAKQGQTISVDVTGHDTHWTGATIFNFGTGINVTGGIVDPDGASATLTVEIEALATVGAHTITASIGGETATLTNGFVVQAGTPLILSSSPNGGLQQAGVTLTILGQATAWGGTTTVDLGAGVAVTNVNPTSATSLTVAAMVHPLALLGPRTLTVTTATQVLTLTNAFQVTAGPAAIADLTPAEAGQGATLGIVVTGVNTHFLDGTTQAFFGEGITVLGTTVTSQTSATANILVAAAATPGQRPVALVTEGETAAIGNGFTVVQTVPFIQFVSPASAAQGSTLDLTVVGSLTNFTAQTVFAFGPDVLVNGVTVISGTQATVNVTVVPVAARTLRAVSATTGGVTAAGAGLFTVTMGPAYISAVSPITGAQGQVGLEVTISGFATHFTVEPPSVSLGTGVIVTQVVVDTDTQLRATVSIDPVAPAQANNVVVTTRGEIATLVGGFTVQQPVVSMVAPASAYQDQTLDVAVTGLHTHFVAGQTGASFGPGVDVNGVTVHSATQATVHVTVQLAAVPGARTVTMTTGLESASGNALFSVLAKETPVISWPTPADIVYGAALGGTQLNATTNIDGSFSYTPDLGTVLSAGSAQVLSVTFTPANTVRYFSATTTVFINVAKANQPSLSVTGQASADYQSSFLVATIGGDGDGLVTFSLTGPCSNIAGGDTITMTSGTGTCSITATKAGDANFFPVTSAAKTVDAFKIAQAALTVTGAPDSVPNGTTFAVNAAGGSSGGGLTFTAIGSCVNAGPQITMTASTGSCSITATRAGDANYLDVTSATVIVAASGPVPPALDVLSSTASLSVPTTGPALPGLVSVRLQVNGVNVLAPGAGITVSASSDNTACVTTTDGTIAGNTYVGSFGVAYATATRPCTAIITATAVGYGSDELTVTVYDYATAPVTASATSLSYYNPALLPSPSGALATSVATLSYYNPALLANPVGGQTRKVASLSYYNPALLPLPNGASATSVAAVSYFNPALLPSPVGGATSKVTSVSYYNPAVLPTPTGQSTTNTAAVSYLNPDGTQSAAGSEPALLAAVQDDPIETTVNVVSVSVANGPTVTRVRPVVLSRSAVRFTLVIDGANLSDASLVRFVGLEPYVSLLPPVADGDGRQLTVDVMLAPNTPLGVVPVVVEGPGWTTPDMPGMRVEIAP